MTSGERQKPVQKAVKWPCVVCSRGVCSNSISVVTVSKCFLLVGFGRFCRKNLGVRFGLGFHDRRVVNVFMVIWHDFHHR